MGENVDRGVEAGVDCAQLARAANGKATVPGRARGCMPEMSRSDIAEDLRLARSTLRARDASVVSVRGGAVRGIAHGAGLRPLLQLLDDGAVPPGCAVADRIVGLAAAKLMAAAGVAAVWSPLGSALAADWLARAGVVFEVERQVPIILGPGGRGECPMERLARTTDDIRAGLAALRDAPAGR